MRKAPTVSGRGKKESACNAFLPAPISPVKLALILWSRDALIGLIASFGWPRWRWASQAVDRLEVAAEALRGEVGA